MNAQLQTPLAASAPSTTSPRHCDEESDLLPWFQGRTFPIDRSADVRLNSAQALELSGIQSSTTLRAYWKRKVFPVPTRPTMGKNGKLFWWRSDIEAWLLWRSEEEAT